MARQIPLIAASRFSVRDYRDAKRDWSTRLLFAQAAAAIAPGATRRACAHAAASATATRVVPTRRNPNVLVEYETAEFSFENQIIVRGANGQMFSDSGDSGSIILQRGSNAAIGLLFGGSPSHTIANHIANVLRSLRVRMA
jgi:hypothetical protein